jgi:ribosomal protein S18 acetylase RimI-like enzyme
MAQTWFVRPLTDDDRPWLMDFLTRAWGALTIVSRGRSRDAAQLPGLVCHDGADVVGLLMYERDGDALELVTLDAFRQREGIGTALVHAAVEAAARDGAARVWLITSNDNLDALRFYQRRGFRLAAVHRNAVDAARRIKPSIPEVGAYGIPIHDELELEYERSESST